MKTRKGRLFSMAAAIVLAVTGVLTGISPSSVVHAANNVSGSAGNGGYSPATIEDVTLLVGDGNPLAGSTVADTIAKADNTYYLGIASQFGIFLSGTFEAKNADAEGRVAVGGDLTFTGEYNYQVGNGDYASMTALKNTEEYSGITNFAHAIVGGKLHNISTLSISDNDGDREDRDSLVKFWNGYNYTIYYPEGEDLYKRFVLQGTTSYADSTHITWPASKNWEATDMPYVDGCEHDSFNPDEESQIYQAQLIDFTSEFSKISERSESVANKSATGEVRVEDGKLYLTAPEGTTSSIIYFTLDPDFNFDSVSEIYYENIPDDSYMIVSCKSAGIEIGKTENLKKTFINNVEISNTGDNSSNNNKNSSRILYNFPEAETVYISCNFNGTILAPNADVTSADDCEGHLSGALIAKSFTGGLEFGYRPFLGPIDILGTQSDYTIDVSKVDGNGHFLAGATFGIYEYDEETGTYAQIPSMTFVSSGAKDAVSVTAGSYMLKEISAPDGYALSDEVYYFDVTEGDRQEVTIADMADDPIPYTPYVTLTTYEMNDGTKTVKAKYTYSELSLKRNIYQVDGVDYKLSLEDDQLTVTGINGETVDEDISSNFAVRKVDVTGHEGDEGYESGYLVFYNGNLISPTIDLCKSEYAYVKNPTDAADPEFKITDGEAVTFKKVDEAGNPLKGADIVLEKGAIAGGEFTVSETVDWDWSIQKSSTAIDVDTLENESVYRIHEAEPPSGYDYGNDLYLVKIGDAAYWCEVARDKVPTVPSVGDTTGWTEINMTSDVAGRILTMTDAKLTGAKVQLQKVTAGSNKVISSGATLELYKEDGTLVTTVTNGNTLLGEYLEPGIYYILESKVPNGYETDLLNKELYFTVKDDYSVEAGKPAYVVDSNPASDGVISFGETYANKDIARIEMDVSSVSWGSGGIQFKPVGDSTVCQATISNIGTVTYTPSTSLAFGDGGRMKITYWNATIDEIRYYLASTDDENVDTDSTLDISTVGNITMIKLPNTKVGAEETTSIVINKTDMTDGAALLPGASMTLTAADSTVDLSDVTVIGETGDDERTDNPVASDSKHVVAWTSRFGSSTLAGVLPDGEYTLEEIAAPDGYTLVKTTFTFTITDGAIVSSDADSDNFIREDHEITVKDALSAIKIDKRDVSGNKEVDGATLTLKNDDVNWDAVVERNPELQILEDGVQWTSGTTAMIIEGLPDGTYTLAETGDIFTSEDGTTYAIVNSTVIFTIENGEIVHTKVITDTGEETSALDEFSSTAESGYYYYNSEEDANLIVVCDAETTSTVDITVQKSDFDNGDTIVPGASMKLTSVDGFDLTSVEVDGKVMPQEETTSFSWISETGTDVIKGLLPGTYTLEENIAPDTYQSVKSTFEFTVDKDGKITVNSADTIGEFALEEDENGNEMIVVKDKISTITIGKKDVSGSSEIAGATLVLTLVAPDETGAALEEVTVKRNDTVLDENAVTITENTITYTTDGEYETILEGLPDGEYQLAETGVDGKFTAPDGTEYLITESVLTFTIKNGEIVSVGEDAHNTFDAAAETSYYYYNSDKDANLIVVCDAEAEQETTTTETETTTEETTATETETTTEETTTTETETTTEETTATETETTTEETTATETETTTEETTATETETATEETTATETETATEETTATETETTTEETTATETETTTEDTTITETETTTKNTTTTETESTTEKATSTETSTATEASTSTDTEISTQSSAGPTTPTESSETTADTTVSTSVSETAASTQSSAGPTTPTESAETTADTTVSTSVSETAASTQSSAGPTTPTESAETTADTTVSTSVSETAASTQSSSGSTTPTDTETTTDTTVTEASTSAETVTSSETETTETTSKTTETTTETSTSATEETTTITTTVAETYEVFIDKQEIAGGEKTGAEVVGASLNVTDEDGAVIDAWISDGTRHRITGLEDDKIYTLQETGAPDGYAYAASIDFTRRDGQIFIVEADGSLTLVADGMIVMYDEAIAETTTETEEVTETTTETISVTYGVNISKQEILGGVETGKEVPGASLELRHEDGTLIDAWISGEEPHYIEGLTENVIYTLTETQAPDGYEIAESIEFTIIDGVVYIVKDGAHTQAEFTIVMLDRFISTNAPTTEETTTTTTTTTTEAETTEAPVETEAAVVTTAWIKDETLVITTEKEAETPTTTTAKADSAVTTKTTSKNNTGVSSGGTTSTKTTKVSSSPKTGDRTTYHVAAVSGLALLLAVAAAVTRKKR